MELKQFLKVKKEVESLKSEKDRAEGALDGLKKRLLEEFGCTTIEQAKKLLKKLEKRERVAEKRFNKAYDAVQSLLGRVSSSSRDD